MRTEHVSAQSPPDPQPPPPPPVAPRPRPYWVVAFALLGLVLAMLGVALLLDRHFRPRVGIEPASASPNQATSPTPASMAELPFATTPLEREVEAAYWKFLRTHADAVLELDTSRLSEVLDGQPLQWVTDEVNDLKGQGLAAKLIEDERILTFINVTGTAVTVEEQYVSRSVYVDPQTKQLVPRTGPPERIRQTYEFRRVNGVWKVVDGTQEVIGEVSP